MPPFLPLARLAAGQSAQVHQVLGQPEQVHRLHELGLRGGAEVEMIQAGTPCIIRLAGSKLCFRGDDMLSVLVSPGLPR
jgi:Fe2+ transport system protein FeoA